MTSDPAGNLWDASCAETIETGPLEGTRDVDLAIIGGGFTGCSAALEAAQTGASVCLLEADRIGQGGSGRNVGLVNAGLWLPPEEIIGVLGEDSGRELLSVLGEAPATVFRLIEKHGIDCEATRNGTLHCAHSRAGVADLENRFRQQNELGAPVRLLDARETVQRTGSPTFHGALYDPRAGTVQPKSYCRGLARAAAEAGALICQDTPAVSVTFENDAWGIATPNGVVRARALLLATNAYHSGVAGVTEPGFVKVGFLQVATAPLSKAQLAGILPGGEGCWDTATVMSSFRLDRSGRLIVGGIGNLDGPGAAVHRAWARRKIRQVFPDIGPQEIEYAWHGQIAMTGDHVPKILSLGPRGYACFGYSGRGIGPGTVFGTAAARALLRDDPGRLPLRPVPRHDERFAQARATYYEFGAIAAHAVAARL